ncbi:leucine-rich repeat transmembrane neuronal protein 4-like isoform X2 [Contarinia nasturtii]|uniref:leucine-rich repeat transmembrane neuronal protein 4-like isoform X2 n=1 Tax=Contarinia nasturtii TaxID=265458 RepID=UPI0012D43C9E|nr:leucine-rich repeat transmembrane neuronal protein 4-like isoform X2 [Contarinia nasturtii]
MVCPRTFILEYYFYQTVIAAIFLTNMVNKQLLLLTSFFCVISSIPPHMIDIPNHDYQILSAIDKINSRCKCKHLEELNFSNNTLFALPGRFFSNCSQLNSLILSNNKIMEMANDTFDNLFELRHLDLSFNRISAFPKDIFKSLINICILLLNGNRIQAIESDLFYYNQNMWRLDLSFNNLRIIQSETFCTLKNLYFLDVYSNKNLNSINLTCAYVKSLDVSDCGLTQLFVPPNMHKISADNNQIDFVDAQPNSNLKHLSMSYNKLTNLSMLSPLVNLVFLDIEHNLINYIDFTDLSNLKDLKFLYFELNPNQKISIADIKQILPLIRQLHIISPNLSTERKNQILYDCKQFKLDININGEVYSPFLELLASLEKKKATVAC